MNLQPIQVTQAQEYTQPTLTTFQSVLNNARESKENLLRMQEFKLRAQQQLNDQLFQQGSQLQMNEVRFNQQMQQLEFRDRMNHGIQNRIDARDAENRKERIRHNTTTEYISGLNYSLSKERFDWSKSQAIKENELKKNENQIRAESNEGIITQTQLNNLPKAVGIKLPEGKIDHILNVDKFNGTVDIKLAGAEGKTVKGVNIYDVLSKIEQREVVKNELSGLIPSWRKTKESIDPSAISLGITTTGQMQIIDGAVNLEPKRQNGKYYLSSAEKYLLYNKAVAGNTDVQMWLRDNEQNIASAPEVAQNEFKRFMTQVNETPRFFESKNMGNKTINDVISEINNNDKMPNAIKTSLINSAYIIKETIEFEYPERINQPIKDIPL